LKRHIAAQHAQLWWDYPPCRPAPNKHTYFTILQIVESAFGTSEFYHNFLFLKKCRIGKGEEQQIEFT